MLGWTYSASDVALIEPCRRRNSSSVARSCAPRCASYSASFADRVDGRVADAAVDGDAEEVLVRAEVVVGEHGRRSAEDDRPDERLLRLGEAVRERGLALADARHADGDRLAELLVERRSRSRKASLDGLVSLTSARSESSRWSNSDPGAAIRSARASASLHGSATSTT